MRLREEQVHVERRPGDGPVSNTDPTAFTEGTLEVSATREEPVVSKQVRVVGEVAVRKDAHERTETVRDTVLWYQRSGWQSGSLLSPLLWLRALSTDYF